MEKKIPTTAETIYFPRMAIDHFPVVDRDMMRRIDEIVTKRYGVMLEQMMELAGSRLAEVALRLFREVIFERGAIVLAGKGNNGGGGLVAARHLANRGIKVALCSTIDREKMSPLLKARSATLASLSGVSFFELHKEDLLHQWDGAVVIDALVGYNLKGPPRGRVAELVTSFQTWSSPILSLDLPTGLDTDTGEIYEPCFAATATLTLAAPKAGFLKASARPYFGRLFLADIGIPSDIGRYLKISWPYWPVPEGIIELIFG